MERVGKRQKVHERAICGCGSNTPLLLPQDLREWVQEDDLVHFLVDALALLDLPAARVNQRGSGSEQYPPGMMLALLIYCYANGLFSSRQIERANYQNLSVRYLAGNTHLDHDTIAKFRRDNGALLQSVFVQLLQVCARHKRGAGFLLSGIDRFGEDGWVTSLIIATRNRHKVEEIRAIL